MSQTLDRSKKYGGLGVEFAWDGPSATWLGHSLGAAYRVEANSNLMQAWLDAGHIKPVRETKTVREDGPAWHDAPTCAGMWVAQKEFAHTLHLSEGFEPLDAWKNYRWYGPIPADEVKP